jgi:hypothetical protein
MVAVESDVAGADVGVMVVATVEPLSPSASGDVKTPSRTIRKRGFIIASPVANPVTVQAKIALLKDLIFSPLSARVGVPHAAI